MTTGLSFLFAGDEVPIPGATFLTPNPRLADARGGTTLRDYGRAVWSRAVEDALAWRRSGSGLRATRLAGVADALWWAALDGPFEMTGGVLDLTYRAHVLAAALADAPRGPVRAVGRPDDPWMTVLAEVCRTQGRDLRTESRDGPPPRRVVDVRHQLRLALRQVAASVRPRRSRADVLLILTHGGMTTRDTTGALVDRYSVLFADALRRSLPVTTLSLEPPIETIAEVRALLRGEYRPWSSLLSARELLAARSERERWADTLRRESAFALAVGGADLGPALSGRPLTLAARGIPLAHAYALAIARACERSGARAIVAVEGHANVGRAAGLAAPGTHLLAPQGGIIAPDGSTNAAYDHRLLPPSDGRVGCPVPARSLVWGPYYRDVLIGLGHAPATIAVTGLPRDVALYRDVPDGYILFAATANDDVCAFASGFEEEIATILALRDRLSPRRRLVVRLHPAHDIRRYRTMLPADVVTTSARTRTLGEDLVGAALVISRSSTVLVEALAGGLRVAVVNLGAAPDLTGFPTLGIPYASNEAEIGPVIDRALASPPLENVIASPIGAGAAERVVAATAEVLA